MDEASAGEDVEKIRLVRAHRVSADPAVLNRAGAGGVTGPPVLSTEEQLSPDSGALKRRFSGRDRRPRRRLFDDAHAVCRRRCWFMRGARWNLPFFMIARMRVLSWRMRTSAIGSPSTRSRSAR